MAVDDQSAAIARRAEPEILVAPQLGARRGVVHLEQVDVGGADPGLCVGSGRCTCRPENRPRRVRRTCAPPRPALAPRGRRVERLATHSVRTSAAAPSAIGLHMSSRSGSAIIRECEHLLERHRVAELRLRVHRRVPTVLHRHHGDVGLGGAGSVHVGPSPLGVHRHERRLGRLTGSSRRRLAEDGGVQESANGVLLGRDRPLHRAWRTCVPCVPARSFSAPTTRTTSAIPDAIAMQPMLSALAELAHAFSTLRTAVPNERRLAQRHLSTDHLLPVVQPPSGVAEHHEVDVGWIRRLHRRVLRRTPHGQRSNGGRWRRTEPGHRRADDANVEVTHGGGASWRRHVEGPPQLQHDVGVVEPGSGELLEPGESMANRVGVDVRGGSLWP